MDRRTRSSWPPQHSSAVTAPADAEAPKKEVPAPAQGTGTQQRRQTSNANNTSGCAQNTANIGEQTRAFLDAVFGDGEGYVHTAAGISPYLNEGGKYEFKKWKEKAVEWPKDRDRLIDALTGAAGQGYDVYLSPYLSTAATRAKGAGIRRNAHVDFDGTNLDLADVERLGGFAVASGTEGHAHIQVPLAFQVTAAQHDILCRALARRFGGDNKFSDNDLLRPPGTLNFKPTMHGNPPAPVQFLIAPTGQRVDPFDLAAELGVDIANTGNAQGGDTGPQDRQDATDSEPEPFDLDSLPQSVKDALARESDDRSEDSYRIVGACYDASLTLSQTRFVIQSRPDLAARLEARNDDDVLTCWVKIRERDWTKTKAVPESMTMVAREVVDLTDSGNTDILVATFSKNLRYCPDIKKWYAWDENRWRQTPADAHAYLAARTVANNLPLGDFDNGRPDATMRHYVRSRNRAGLDAMVALARRHPDMQVSLDTLDNNRYELNTPDGIINLRTGELTRSDPKRWHTKITGTGYNPGATPDKFLAFLNTTFGGDQELIDYIQTVAGISAIGEVLEHILPFCFGVGANGKTVLLEILAGVLGDYAVTSPGNFLLAGRDKHETEIARLHGARLVVCSELNAGSKFDEAKAKSLTGGDKLTGHFMHKDFFDFQPSHTLWIAANNQPDVTSGGTSFWRRLRLIPFPHTVKESDRVQNLAVKLLHDEGQAILAWIVAGAVKYLSDGITTPQVVQDETGEYSDNTLSGVGRFIQEVCTLNTGNIARADAVYRSYLAWAADSNEPSLNIQKFGLDMKAAGVVSGPRQSRGRSYDLTVHTDRLPPSQQTGKRRC